MSLDKIVLSKKDKIGTLILSNRTILKEYTNGFSIRTRGEGIVRLNNEDAEVLARKILNTVEKIKKAKATLKEIQDADNSFN